MRLIVTNNPMVPRFIDKDGLPYEHQLVCVDGFTEQVLKMVRDLCHKGYALITHPLTGSIKPNLTPYKTVVLERLDNKVTSIESVIMAEECLQKTSDLLHSRPRPSLVQHHLDDFAVIDLDFYKSYVVSLIK